MSSYIHLVFSEPPSTVSDDDYNTWYDVHVQDILSVEGWESATRYTIEAVVGAGGSKQYRFLSLYELSCPPAVAVANLAAANIGADDMGSPLPDWFTAIDLASWNGTQVSGRISLQGIS